jgi:hypothetical protein
MPKTWEVELEDGKIVEIESDTPPSPDQINTVKQHFSSTNPNSEKKGFLDRLTESSNVAKAVSHPLDTIGSLVGSALPGGGSYKGPGSNIITAGEALFPPMIPARMALEGLAGYGTDVIDREKRLFDKMNDDPDSAALTAGQMLAAPIPFAGKLVEPLEEDIMQGNLSGAAGSVGGVALDALASRLAPEAMKAPGTVGRAVGERTLKPLGQKLYSHGVAREAAKQSVPHMPNPMPYIRNPYNPVMLSQDALRAGSNVAKSSRVIQMEKNLGKYLNPEAAGLGENKPGFGGVFPKESIDPLTDKVLEAETRSPGELIDAEDSANFRRENEFERIMNQERLNYSPRDFERPIDTKLGLQDFDPSISSDTPMNRMIQAREAKLPDFVEPVSNPTRGVSATRGKLSQLDPNAFSREQLEPSIPRSLDDMWTEQMIEEEAGGRQALAPPDLAEKFGAESRGLTPEQIAAEQSRMEKMSHPPDVPPPIEKPLDAPVIENSPIVQQLLDKGIPEHIIKSMTPEQMQAALMRKGTRASGTNPRSLSRVEGSGPKDLLRNSVESEIVSLGRRLKELRPTANTVKGFKSLSEDAYGKATGKYGEGEAHLDFDQIVKNAESNADSRKLTGEVRSKAIAQDIATKSVDATLHEAAHGPSKGHGTDFDARMQDLRESLGRGGYERLVKELKNKILSNTSSTMTD